ncbi:MAG TPA: 30S ribosomal protein S20 [Candidatus Portnoybacteria bacterium]|jgi:small subunit ribosomal protein S20|nr:30S ribosomal protein S20 [Candidatus Portnoybacteria bacterium]MDD5752166.1 30S ribosomal protein S20 [Candidatus Portnoybacteria bacterium]HNU96870.1 30S ribosomal protein S20 [Candidatus Portnoybacteria bacterium]HOZ16438.1 30S ribosomal protein S20 [Candidatus Portnoybacteria bacterium]HPH52130.1 30S ribosomal protein S20 [Candidatus Portnoybacteria bacterium]
MPIKKSAKKALRQNKTRRQRNLRRLDVSRNIIKKIKKIVEEGKRAAQKGESRPWQEEANKLLPLAYKAIDKAAKTGVIKKNTSARKKSRLTKFINKK